MSPKKIYEVFEYELDEDEVYHIENKESMEVTPINEIILHTYDQYGNYKDFVWIVILN